MQVKKIHDWNLTPKEAVQVQRKLKKGLCFPKLTQTVRTVAGADLSFSKGDARIFAAVVILKIDDMKVIEIVSGVGESPFPYIPGLLAFRELPLLCDLFSKLPQTPDVLICDGQGIAHPRGLGIASHLGLLLNIPTIGCAKKRLVGRYDEVGKGRWSRSALIHKNEIVGTVLRTRENVKPIFISPGNNIDLESAVVIVQQCITRYRLPEPTRMAHLHVNKFRKEAANYGHK